MWQLLPFDDLARYQQLGYDTRHIEWITTAVALGLVLGATLVLCSNEASLDGFIMLFVGFIGLSLVAGVMQMNEMSATPYIYALPHQQIETKIIYLRANACIIACFLGAAIVHVGSAIILGLGRVRKS